MPGGTCTEKERFTKTDTVREEGCRERGREEIEKERERENERAKERNERAKERNEK